MDAGRWLGLQAGQDSTGSPSQRLALMSCSRGLSVARLRCGLERAGRAVSTRAEVG